MSNVLSFYLNFFQLSPVIVQVFRGKTLHLRNIVYLTIFKIIQCLFYGSFWKEEFPEYAQHVFLTHFWPMFPFYTPWKHRLEIG